MSDADLLRSFVHDHNESAFTALVRKYVEFVYGAARRQTHGDIHRAEEVTQEVFIQLARKAPKLAHHPCLVGWLHNTTRLAALDRQRRDRRRAQRERDFEAMNELKPAPTTHWEKVGPVIDDAMQDLDEGDRHAVLLRFFSNQSFQQIGETIGASENAAQKRVTRALDQLSAALARRGVLSTAAALALGLAESGTAAPASLAGSVAQTALAAAAKTGVTVSSVVAVGKILLGASAAAAAGFTVGVRHEREASNNRVAEIRGKAGAGLKAAETRAIQASDRAALAEADMARLLAAIDRAKSEREAAAAAAPEPVVTETISVFRARAADILPIIMSVVDPAVGGKLLVDARTNTLIMTERPSRLAQARRLTSELDR